ncbi:hypothetical protein DL95DRAFT_468233 [Leptodontidium sp. 2 PMI_412]|nr:hypothetical protein DL95DRAFT_468233 [Leptodontidium sp. 2 PMI_412]
MAPLDFLTTFRDSEGAQDPLRASWYIAAAAGFAAINQGELLPVLYRSATLDLSLEDAKIVQRRIKEVILKCSVFYGVPRSGQALGPLYNCLSEEEIDHYGPRDTRP